MYHFYKYAADTPHVHLRGVVARTHEDVRSSVPQGHDFVCVVADRHTERPSQTTEIQDAERCHESQNTDRKFHTKTTDPKSASFSSPILLMRRFCGFKSRWRTRLAWQNPIPLRSW